MTDFPQLPLVNYADIRDEIANGDILLCSGEYMSSRLIRKASASCWSHVAFILRADTIDRVMVLESIEGKGVRTIPLSEYVRNFEGSDVGYKGRLALARHADFAARLTPDSLKKMSQFAVDRLSYPYDEEEIARITARIIGAFLDFSPGEIARDNEFICSEYVYECYRRIGIDIPYDPRGFIAPADFARAEGMNLQWEIAVER